MEAHIKKALNRRSFDIVIASEIGPGLNTSVYLLEFDNIPWVVEDLELSMIFNQIQAQQSFLQKFRHKLTWWKQRNYAINLLNRTHGCTVASEHEQALVKSIVADFEPLAVIPNGMDLKLYEDKWGPTEPDALIFPGALTYWANFEAMAFFLESVFPLIRVRRSTVTLRITGQTDNVPLHRLRLDDSVILTGYLQDIRPTLAQSKACVVPLTTGGGTRLKILEAMALGTPVVSTTRGAEGLDVTPGENILLADNPNEFADATLRLLDDDALQDKLTANGRRLVREKYNWDEIGERLDQFLQQVVRRYKHRQR
jgi:glycosyltransferase involved in cell wall biosynthesis